MGRNGNGGTDFGISMLCDNTSTENYQTGKRLEATQINNDYSIKKHIWKKITEYYVQR